MAKKSQRKGRAGELELARILQARGFDVKPGEPVSFGTTPDLTGLQGVHVECKRAEQLRLDEWLTQAERDSERFQDGLAAVFHRRNRSPWVVSMSLENWLILYELATKKGGGTE